MNVIISNERQGELANLDIEVIKSINGVYESEELIQMFSNFFFGKNHRITSGYSGVSSTTIPIKINLDGNL